MAVAQMKGRARDPRPLARNGLRLTSVHCCLAARPAAKAGCTTEGDPEKRPKEGETEVERGPAARRPCRRDKAATSPTESWDSSRAPHAAKLQVAPIARAATENSAASVFLSERTAPEVLVAFEPEPDDPPGLEGPEEFDELDVTASDGADRFGSV